MLTENEIQNRRLILKGGEDSVKVTEVLCLIIMTMTSWIQKQIDAYQIVCRLMNAINNPSITDFKEWIAQELERCLGSLDHSLLLQRTLAQFSALTGCFTTICMQHLFRLSSSNLRGQQACIPYTCFYMAKTSKHIQITNKFVITNKNKPKIIKMKTQSKN